MMLKKYCLLLFCLLWAGAYASADTVILKNGKVFEGNIYDFKGAMVKMEKTTGGSFVIQVKQIQSIDSQDNSEEKQAIISNIQAKLTDTAGPQAARPAGPKPSIPEGGVENPGQRQKYDAPEYDFIEKPQFRGGLELGKKPGANAARGEEDDDGDEEEEDEGDLGDTTRGRFKKTVEFFVGPSCPDCEKMESFLKRSNIVYRRYDITASPAAKNRYESYRLKVLPVTVINGKPCLGYQPEQVKYLLLKEK